jgi:hypothetical protein
MYIDACRREPGPNDPREPVLSTIARNPITWGLQSRENLTYVLKSSILD